MRATRIPTHRYIDDVINRNVYDVGIYGHRCFNYLDMEIFNTVPNVNLKRRSFFCPEVPTIYNFDSDSKT